jgi:CBS domain-containing protein
MVSAREIMHDEVQGVRSSETLAAAAAKMRNLHVGALPVLGAEDELQGIITDRDIVVRCVADGTDPQSMTAEELLRGGPISVDASSDVSEVLATMEQHKIRRVPVVEDDRLVGIISEANLATQLGRGEVGDFAASVYSAPPNN